MSFLQRLFGKKGEVIEDPVALRERLFDAATRGDGAELAGLCNANREAIRSAFPSWLKPPPQMFESDPRRVDWYGRGLTAIGEHFAHRLGDASLLQQMRRPEEQNPFPKWTAEIGACIELMRAHQFEGALPRLHELRAAVRVFVGFEAKRMESVAVGHIGHCLQQTGRSEEALAHFEDATLLCREGNDQEGVRVQLSNRIETLRWMDRHRDAVPWAEQLAELHEQSGNPADAARYRARARIMAEGEPLLRIVFKVGDRVYEEDEVPMPLEGDLDLLLERNRLTLARCEARLEEGGRHIGSRRYDEALAAFASAASADPHAPRPHYESGFVHLMAGRYDQAIASYEQTERLAPGWFIVRSETWLARQLARGRFEREVPEMLHGLEGLPPQQVVEFARAMADRFPDLPQAWLMLGEGLHRLGRAGDAEASYVKGLACSEDPDTRTRLLVSLAVVEQPHRRVELEQAAALNGHLVAGATARLLLRSADAAARRE